MWEFHHPLRPHLSDFRINIGSKKIPSNREVIYSISPVISNYLSRYPNNDFFSISLNELNKDTDINFKKLDIKILSCLFLGLNFHVNESNRLQLQIISNFLQIEPLTSFLLEINNKIKTYQNVFSQSSELIEFVFLEDTIFSMTEQNFETVLNFISEKVDHYGHSTICKVLFNFYVSRPLKRNLLINLLDHLKNVRMKDFLKSKSIHDSRVENEIYTLIDYYRKKEIENENNNNNNEKDDQSLLKIIQNDDYDEFIELSRSVDFDINKEIETKKQSTILQDKCSLINCAAFFGSEKIFNFLLLNQATSKKTVAKFAIAGGNVNIIHNIEFNLPDFSFDNTLKYTIYYHHHELFEWLIETKNQSFKIDELIEIVLFFSSFKTLKYLIDQVNDFQDFTYLSFLNSYLLFVKLASRFDDLIKPFLDSILEFKIDIKNMMIFCVENNQNDLVHFLFSLCKENEKNVIYKTENKDLQNLLHICCFNNNFSLLEFIIGKLKGKRKNSETKNEAENQPGLNEVENQLGLKEVENQLGSNEIDLFKSFVNKVDKNDQTPLCVACESLATESIEILLNLEEVDLSISNPIFQLISQNSYEHVKLFLDNDRFDITKISEIFDYAISFNSSLQIIELIISHPKIDSQIVMSGFYSLIQNLNTFENLEPLKKMFEKVDLTYQDENGYTFLHRICSDCRCNKLFELIQMVVSINPNCININNFEKQKPFALLALKVTEDCYEEIIKSRDFLLNFPSLELDESDVESMIQVSNIKPIKQDDRNHHNYLNSEYDYEEEEEEEEDEAESSNDDQKPLKVRKFLDSEAESVDSYSDHPILKDEDIPGIDLYPVSNPNLKNINDIIHIDNDEEEEEEDNSENDIKSDNDSSDNDNRHFPRQKVPNIGNVVVISDTDDDDRIKEINKQGGDDDDDEENNIISLSESGGVDEDANASAIWVDSGADDQNNVVVLSESGGGEDDDDDVRPLFKSEDDDGDEDNNSSENDDDQNSSETDEIDSYSSDKENSSGYDSQIEFSDDD